MIWLNLANIGSLGKAAGNVDFLADDETYVRSFAPAIGSPDFAARGGGNSGSSRYRILRASPGLPEKAWLTA